MKAITLKNPKGETKEFTNVEFYEFKTEVLKNKNFQAWSKEVGVAGTYIRNGGVMMNSMIIESYLYKRGYIVVKNEFK